MSKERLFFNLFICCGVAISIKCNSHNSYDEPNEINKMSNNVEELYKNSLNHNPYYFTPIHLDSVLKYHDLISNLNTGDYIVVLNKDIVVKCAQVYDLNVNDTIIKFQKKNEMYMMTYKLFKEKFSKGKYKFIRSKELNKIKK